MRNLKRTRDQGGFTLMELMISAGLLGIMIAIAIPLFTSYQARSRRSEAFSNLGSLARAYKAYAAEAGAFPDMLSVSGEPSLPDPTAHGGIGTRKMPWDGPTQTFFDTVGWQSDGKVFYTYDVNTAAGCTCTHCFTATAHGDVDGDGTWAALMYVHPQTDSDGSIIGSCPSAIGTYGPPIRPQTGDTIYDEAAIQLSLDDY